ncbi:hypothetical protein [Rubellimicrobium roseum]|uniref:Uncharacterized protein n=1 Tax=Rubellimicrobium roseum TaxID=687525 RepID=A0A5C4NM20_9RHOB|nr:hypothetical protein [Rubellimicrobium roseum]TNC73737.1 hypothetical protein FHG71_04465 [Rubellimicrobium roseum]
MKARALVAGLAIWGGAAAAADLVVAGAAGTVAWPGELEVVRNVGSRDGHRVVVPEPGGARAAIEWRSPVEVRVRTLSGERLSPALQAAARVEATTCDRGVPVDAREAFELNGTYVLRFDCAWLQDQ